MTATKKKKKDRKTRLLRPQTFKKKLWVTPPRKEHQQPEILTDGKINMKRVVEKASHKHHNNTVINYKKGQW